MKLMEITATPSQQKVAKTQMDDSPQNHPSYMCVLHNDDYTDGAALVELIAKNFRHAPQQAQEIVMMAHRNGECPCGGPYTKDEAETRADNTMKAAEMHPQIGGGPAPLKISVEEIDH